MRVSVVLMTYAERDSIRGVIDGFFDTGVVDEVVVVNNNAQPGTSEEVAKTEAREVFETAQGYGNATRRGLREAEGDLVLLAEPDGTFVPADIFKMLSYSGECEAVLGTRTTRELIWSDANMGWFLRWGNWAVAKLVEVMFNTSHISDMGCSLRLFNRRMADYVADNMRVGESHAGAEILMLVLLSGARFVEIPVNYLPRVGQVVGDRGSVEGVRPRAEDDRPGAGLPCEGASAAAARRRAGRRDRGDPGRQMIQEQHFDEVADGLRREPSGARHRPLPRQAHQVRHRALPAARHGCSMSAAVPGPWPPSSPPAATRRPGSTRPRACSRCSASGRPR